MDKKVINQEDVLERVQDDWELLLELLDIFLDDYEEKRTLLEQEIARGDFEQIRNIAHSLKGAAGNISAEALHQVFWDMEQAAVNQDMKQIRDLSGELDQRYPALQESIEQIKQDYQKKQG